MHLAELPARPFLLLHCPGQSGTALLLGQDLLGAWGALFGQPSARLCLRGAPSIPELGSISLQATLLVLLRVTGGILYEPNQGATIVSVGVLRNASCNPLGSGGFSSR